MAVFDVSAAEAMDVPDSPVAETRNEKEAAAPAWSPFRRIVFRFAFSYLVLYLFLFYLQMLEIVLSSGTVSGWYDQFWATLVSWVGKHLLHVDAPSGPTGSGDAIFSWVQILCMLAV